ncbi:DUF2252 domain-containing protein [Hoyosella subflava]|uniref:DUF2252 domain-containing protein n=1 Tax=Hoyosella subflava (strain DSM 45089 / JCM 17490 / NBRC 109087 / DQS3-9A1) TaxID=443218 RepID=F6EJW8_HOYSD|nr:DUF2252 domain-containing protein [Hoyosella subflava]AEF41326.1 hypothetical protein AS9A_2879 [Hoyosella subflava DQS3-9A1]
MMNHRVLADADSRAYGSMRDQPVSRDERYKVGQELRHSVPRSSLAEWKKPNDRADPVEQVNVSHQGRLDWLVPVRVGRMIASPYGFLRGTAGLMATDVATLPATGIMPVICGDSHMGNFGFYASPERELVFDLNDFDEAHPGGWEWDLRRLVASIWVAGRQNGASEGQCGEATHSCVEAYRGQLRRLAEMPLLQRHFERLDVDRLRATANDSSLRHQIERSAKRARKRTSDRALPRFTEERDGQRRIVEEPPLITSLGEKEATRLAEALDQYLESVPSQWRRVLAGYTVRDVAHKVVGVGSVGLRAYVVLCEGSSPDDVLFLQLKQARRSVIARFVHGDDAWHAHQGQRVVEYQHALQTASDPLLGWTSFDGRQFYVRQFRNMKGAIDIDDIDTEALADYARICGHLLAKGHARTSGASMIAGYLGKSDKVAESLSKFAKAYADQTEEDHQALVDAVKNGKIPAE